jgi:hypothetical protein
MCFNLRPIEGRASRRRYLRRVAGRHVAKEARQFGGGALDLAVQSVGGSEPSADKRLCRVSAKRLFQQVTPS